jgi:hypothetical protein
MGFVGELGGIGDQEHRTVCARATTTQPASAPAVVEIVVRRRLCQRAFLFRGTTLPGGRFSRSDGRLPRRRRTEKSTGKKPASFFDYVLMNIIEIMRTCLLCEGSVMS